MTDRLLPGEGMNLDGAIFSNDGRFKLTLQTDGNLVLYKGDSDALFATGTVNWAVSYVQMRKDGNFVLYSPSHKELWSTKTQGHPDSQIVMQDDGNLVIYDSEGNALWATGTNLIPVPDVVGMNHIKAKILLESQGFRVKENGGFLPSPPLIPNPPDPTSHVIKQDPEGGTPVPRDSSIVTLWNS